MLGFNRWHLFIGLAAILCVVGVVSLAMSYIFPAPPSKIIIATAFKGATFEYYGKRYRERFARANVNLELRETEGSVENLKLLLDPNSDVQIAFMQGGISDAEHAPGLLSLGLAYNNPFWIFYSSTEPLDRLSQLKGKRIAVGPIGSGTRQAAEKILGAGSITATNAIFLPLGGTAAVGAMKDGKVDAVWIASAPDAPAVQQMLRMPNVRLLSFARAEALTRIFPDLVRLVLPQGVFDIDRDIPPNDVPLVATTNRVLIRADVHPAIITLLIETMIKEHGIPGVFQRAGDFPTSTDPEYPMAPSAVDYYKNGPSFLQRHLPLWLTVHVQRAIAVLVAGIAISLPLFNFGPKIYMWFVRERMSKLYRRLRSIEKALQTELAAPQVAALQSDLENVDQTASHLWIPMRHSALLFGLKVHCNLIRTRLAAHLAELRSHVAKVA